METFVMSVIGGVLMIAYMLFRANRLLAQENRDYRKDARAAQARADQLENELEKQKLIGSSSKVTPFPTASDGVMKAKYSQLKGEYDLLKNEHSSAIDVLSRIKTDVDKSENMSNMLAIKIRAYLTSVIGLAS